MTTPYTPKGKALKAMQHLDEEGALDRPDEQNQGTK